jgi:shikimate dehydrogenase
MSISGATRLYGVAGDPVAHSLSPLIHNRWMAEAKLDAAYVALHLQSQDAAADLKALARSGFSGLNITLPHKIAALAAAANSSPEARAIGAANTLVRDGAGWFAHNTDVEGFEEAIRLAVGKGNAGRVILIGAGGAARAAAFSMGKADTGLTIVNRSKANASQLALDLAPGVAVATLDRLPELATGADLIINSASLGHSGEALPELPPGKGRPFLDLSYGKAAAQTLASAEACGWTPHDGLPMLVGQAAAAFRIWFGITPDIAGALVACRAALATRSGAARA